MGEQLGLAVAVIVGFNSLVLFIVAVLLWEIRRLRDWRHAVGNMLVVLNGRLKAIEREMHIEVDIEDPLEGKT